MGRLRLERQQGQIVKARQPDCGASTRRTPFSWQTQERSQRVRGRSETAVQQTLHSMLVPTRSV